MQTECIGAHCDLKLQRPSFQYKIKLKNCKTYLLLSLKLVTVLLCSNRIKFN